MDFPNLRADCRVKLRLMSKPRPFTYAGEHLAEIAFPLGGIGAGCVSLEGRGSLRDWEIWGRPNKGGSLNSAYPTLWCQEQDGEPKALVVHGPRQKGFQGEGTGFWDWGHGQFFKQGDGLPCFDDAEFTGTFPYARVRFEKDDLPLEVELIAHSPFVPLRARDSGFPIAVMTYRIRNRSRQRVDLTLAWSLNNPIGEGIEPTKEAPDEAAAEFRRENGFRGLIFSNDRFEPGNPAHGTVAISTNWPDVDYTERWLEEGWFDAQQHFWNRFRKSGTLEPGARTGKSRRVPGTLGLKASLAPGEEVVLPFAFTWSFPTATKYWADKNDAPTDSWTPYYATQWPDAWAAAQEYWVRQAELDRMTLAFGDALHQSTLPEVVVESVGATLTTLRTPTCLRLEDGTFWAWEGCSPKDGCCAGTCSHVWNYATAHAWLFPEIARSIRETEYTYAFNCGPLGQEGALDFRVPIPLKQETKLWHAASDGQLGGVMQLYRDWRISGDEETLKRLWPAAKRALEFAWVQWDRDRDGLVEGDQHNTYDINFQGPNPLTQFMYLGALKAGAEIGRHLGDPSRETYEELYQKGRAKAEAELWNGEYFIQTNDCLKEDAPKYQHGVGCLSDQLFGALCAKVSGLGDLADPEKTRIALANIFRNNFRAPLGAHENLQRVFAFRDEAGLLLCSWPNGGRPAFPFVYSDEVWTGIEYQVAAHLAFEGMFDEALRILNAIRERFDGRRRNPYNEYECGSHYARALASWSVYLAFSGFRHDAVSEATSFEPYDATGEDVECFYCTESTWGRALFSQGQYQLSPIYENEKTAKP